MDSTARTTLFSAWLLLSGATLACTPAYAADDDAARPYETVATTGGWEYRWTPYGWLTGLYGNATARGRTIAIDASFIDIVEDSNSLFALMSYAEARKGPLSFYLDTVYADLTASGDDVRYGSGPFNIVDVEIDGAVDATYRYAVVEAGAAYEFARLPSSSGTSGAYTAFDAIAGARYWYQEVEARFSLNVGAGLPDGLSFDRTFAVANTGTMSWVDPLVGMRVRHSFGGGHEIYVKGDVGGFGVGSDFSWQLVGAYSWEFTTRNDVTYAGVLGYRALSVDYEQGSGNNAKGIDGTYRGPIVA